MDVAARWGASRGRPSWEDVTARMRCVSCLGSPEPRVEAHLSVWRAPGKWSRIRFTISSAPAAFPPSGSISEPARPPRWLRARVPHPIRVTARILDRQSRADFMGHPEAHVALRATILGSCPAHLHEPATLPAADVPEAVHDPRALEGAAEVVDELKADVRGERGSLETGKHESRLHPSGASGPHSDLPGPGQPVSATAVTRPERRTRIAPRSGLSIRPSARQNKIVASSHFIGHARNCHKRVTRNL